MHKMKWIFARFADALGLPGLLALVLVLGLLLFFPLARWPAQQRLAVAEAAAVKPGAHRPGLAEPSARVFLGQFPRPETLSQELQKVFDTAEGYGLALDEVAYRKVRKPDERLERYLVAARHLVRRGYAVVVPMRQGFSKSGGSYIGGGCNIESNGRVQAEDVVAALAFYSARPDIDARRTVVFGQSHGGLTTLAVGALGLPNIVGLVNFAGGLRQESCNGWERSLADAVGSYARTTIAPTLWFYGDNDSYFTPETWQRMHAQYVAAGGRARLVAFGSFGTDAHELFSSPRGAPVWLPEVGALFTELGLPFTSSKA